MPANRRPRTSRRPCATWDVLPGPHPGCAEFAPPDEVRCSEPATHRVKFAYLGQFRGKSATEEMCERHAKDELADGGVRVYRFRKV